MLLVGLFTELAKKMGVGAGVEGADVKAGGLVLGTEELAHNKTSSGLRAPSQRQSC